jgi:hypothetical protein
VTRAHVTLTISNAGLSKATVLDANGNAAGEAKLVRRGDEVELRFPEDALYVILQ